MSITASASDGITLSRVEARDPGRDQRHSQHRLGEIGGDVLGAAAKLLERRVELVVADLATEDPAEEGLARRGRLEWRLRVEPAQQRRQPQQRVVAQARHRAVAGAPVRTKIEAKDTLLADATV